MSFKCKKLLQTISFFLFCSLANSSVFAFLPDAKVDDAKTAKTFYTGILHAPDATSVRVNGNIAQDGMTILTGAEIKTGNNGGAVIKIYQLGKIELSEATSVKIEFSEQNVAVKALSGQVVLTAYKGVKGKLTDVNGKVLMTDSALETSSIVNSVEILLPVATIAAPTLFGFGIWGTIGIFAGTTAAWLTVANMTDDSQRSISSVQP